MAKRFKFKIPKVLSFRSCRSQDPSTLPTNPLPASSSPASVVRATAVDPPPPSSRTTATTTTKPSKKHPSSSSLRRRVCAALGCGGSFPRCVSETDGGESPPPTPRFRWERDDTWHVIAKVQDRGETPTPRRKTYTSLANDEFSSRKKKLKKKKKKSRGRIRSRKPPGRARVSTSSADTLPFTDEERDEREQTETLIPSSSRSPSTDSLADLNPHPHQKPIAVIPAPRPKSTKKPSAGPPSVSRRQRGSTSESESSPARLSALVQRMVPCTAVAESVAVVKRSSDPYEDFKRSMVEMILEKQMSEKRELEELLRCFLTLNSKRYHGVIVRAFTDVWETLFFARSSGVRRSTVKSPSEYGE